MQTVELFGENIETGMGHSSKGNQLKWEQDGWWYKADAFGYESLAEVVVSRLLALSNITDTVEYEPVIIFYKGRAYRGCRSRNFRREKEELIPLERLARSYTGFGLAKQLSHIAEVKERIRYVEELVRNVTGMEGFGAYLTKMLEIDAFFLNEDRHTNNIALLYDTEKREYRFCPFFDMGLSLFSDTREAYPPEKSFWECRQEICAKPFHRDFDEQLDAANELYGCFLKFGFPANRIAEVVDGIEREYGLQEEDGITGAEEPAPTKQEELMAGEEKERMSNPRREKGERSGIEMGYTKEELNRVREVLRYQAGKYQYMF